MRQINNFQITPYNAPEFSKDIRDFFSGRRSGHLSKWLYSTPLFEGDKVNGAAEWKKLIEDAKNGSPYYVFRDEEAIIRTALPKISKLFDDDTRLIDLGPGSVDAVQRKVVPLLNQARTRAKEYAAVDVCNATLEMAEKEIKRLFPHLKTTSHCRDFFNDTFAYGTPCKQEIATLFGLTLGNITIDPKVPGLSEQMLTLWLKQLKLHFSAKDSYLLITQDVNQNTLSLKKAYMSCKSYYTPLLHRIKRDLCVSSGFNPERFEPEVDFFPETEACALCFVAQEGMLFSVDGETMEVRKGQRFYFHNAFKFSTQTFEKAAKEAGFEIAFTEQYTNNPCILHALKSCAAI